MSPASGRDPRVSTSDPTLDPQRYLAALLLFMAAARDHLDDEHYARTLPLLEALRAIPEPRDAEESP